MHPYIFKSSLAIAIASLFFISCGKDDTGSVTPGFDTVAVISNIEGMRDYTGIAISWGPGQMGVPYKDTTSVSRNFDIHTLQSKDLIVDSDTVKFNTLDTVNKIITFAAYLDKGIYPTTIKEYAITYYYAKDSISYFSRSSYGNYSGSTLTICTL